jgi:chitinase
MLKSLFTFSLIFSLSFASFSQAPNPALVGYWHNWDDISAPYIPLDQIDSRYNIIDVSFAIPEPGTDYQMQFIPDQVSPEVFISQMEALQNEGRKVLISIGGATAPVHLDNEFERDQFVLSMGDIIETYGFDGLDIDLEGSSVVTTGGTIENPTDASITHLIDGVKQIMYNYYLNHNQRLILTMAPETAFVQGGMSSYGGIWGGYLPVINALRDSLEIIHVQLYNSGSMYGVDGGIYNQGTADFIIAMTEALIQGFNTNGGFFTGLPASKIAVGLPACSNAAGGGYTDPLIVESAINYLRGMGPQPGTYQLVASGGYPNLRGMMTWSINWDKVSSCAGEYTYAQTFENLFQSITAVADNEKNTSFSIYPNPVTENLTVVYDLTKNQPTTADLYNMQGQMLRQFSLNANHTAITLSDIPAGSYYLRIHENGRLLIKN